MAVLPAFIAVIAFIAGDGLHGKTNLPERGEMKTT
jgi:hypothetical protein